MKNITLTPAHGRDYKSAKAAKADFDDNKDFIIADMFHPYSGKAANKEQLSGHRVNLRYNSLRNVAVVVEYDAYRQTFRNVVAHRKIFNTRHSGR